MQVGLKNKAAMKILTTCLLFIMQTMCYGQITTEMRNAAYKQLAALGQGTLLVQLPQYRLAIEALRKHDTTKAEILQHNVLSMQQQIVNAFSSYYTYSKVYFFYADNTSLITDKSFTRTVLDSKLQPGQFVPDGHAIFIAAFGHTDPDLVSSNTNNSSDYKATNISLPGLIIYNDKMVPCAKPFPYIIRTHERGLIVSEKKINKAVLQLQKKLVKGF
jgi:hypothetical protein